MRLFAFLLAMVAAFCPLATMAEEILLDDFAGGMSARAEAKVGENPKYRTLNWENMAPNVGEAPLGGARHYSSLIFEGNSLVSSTERVGRDWFLLHRAEKATRGVSVTSWDGSIDPAKRTQGGLSSFLPPLEHITHVVIEDLTVEVPEPGQGQVAIKVTLYDVDDPKGNKALVATLLLTSTTAISRIPIGRSEFKAEDPDAGSFSGKVAAITLTIDGGSLKGVQARIGAIRFIGPELRTFIAPTAIPDPSRTDEDEPSDSAEEVAQMTPVIPGVEGEAGNTEPAHPTQVSVPSQTAESREAAATSVATSSPTLPVIPERVPTKVPSVTPSPTATATSTATLTPSPSHTPSVTPSDTATAVPTATATARPANTLAPAPTASKAPTATAVPPTATSTRTATPSRTSSPTTTPTHTFTSTKTPTATPTKVPTRTPTVAPTAKGSSASPTPTVTPVPQGSPFYGRCAKNLDGKIVCVRFPGEGVSECRITQDCNTPTPSPTPTITPTPTPTATPAQSCICACRSQTGDRDLVCVEPWVFRLSRLGYSCIDQERGTFPWSFEREAGAVPAERSESYCGDRWNGKEGAGYPDYSVRAPGVPCILEQCREGTLH